MAITAAAEKTTAAFFMGFPFAKIVVDNKRSKSMVASARALATFSLNLMLMNARWFARDVGILKCLRLAYLIAANQTHTTAFCRDELYASRLQIRRWSAAVGEIAGLILWRLSPTSGNRPAK
jgi:hypothetical protein